VGAVANVSLATLKIGVGLVSQSQALVADGIHSFSDLVTDAAVILGARFWTAPADSDHPYGHGRIETLVNVLIGVVLAATALGIAWRGAFSLAQAQEDITLGWPALAVTLASIVSKEILYRWTARRGREIGSPATVANAWHHRSDALSSVPVAVAVVAGWTVPDLGYLDQIAAILVAALLLKASWEIAWPGLRELSEADDDPALGRRVEAIALGMEAIHSVHNIRTRRVGGASFVDLHMMVPPEMPVVKAHEVAHQLQNAVRNQEPQVLEVLAHVEPAPAEQTHEARAEPGSSSATER
jgi:cation diffusion facilitator family transporter